MRWQTNGWEWNDPLLSSFGTYSSTVATGDDDSSLTLEKLEKCWAELQLLLPVLRYHTSPYVPLTNKDGKPLIVQLPTEDTAYIVLHPDNLAHLQEHCRGKYRLVPMRDELGRWYDGA